MALDDAIITARLVIPPWKASEPISHPSEASEQLPDSFQISATRLKCTEYDLDQETLLPSTLCLAFNLRCFEFYCYEFTPALSRIIFSLPQLANLRLEANHFHGDYDGEHLLSSNLTTLALAYVGSNSVPTEVHHIADILHHLPKLTRLDLPYRTTEKIFVRLLSRPLPHLKTLAVRATFDQIDEHSFRRYVEQYCSDLKTLIILGESEGTLPLLRQYLPRLRVFEGPLAIANSCISDLIEDLVLTHPNSEQHVTLSLLTSLFTSSSSLRRLEMVVGSVNPAMLRELFVCFPNLRCLKFTFTDQLAYHGGPDWHFLTQFPDGCHPIFRNLTEFAFEITYLRQLSRELMTEYADWQRPIIQMWGHDNPLLSEVELYSVLWTRHGLSGIRSYHG